MKIKVFKYAPYLPAIIYYKQINRNHSDKKKT